MKDITFVIFTFNEEARIERVIKSLMGFGKILIADNKSTDRTQEIARSYGCDILIREKQIEFAETEEMVNLIYEKVSTEWIYWSGGADEMLDIKTLQEITKVIATNKYDIISMDRKNYFYGRFCYDMFHARTNRLFKKNAISFKDNVIHSMGTPTVTADRIYHLPDNYFVHHFISNTASTYLNTINGYTDSEILFKYNTNRSIWFLFYCVFGFFVREFIKGRGYKAGFSGVALVELIIFYKIVKNMKHYEKDNDLDFLGIEKLNNIFREKILQTQK